MLAELNAASDTRTRSSLSPGPTHSHGHTHHSPAHNQSGPGPGPNSNSGPAQPPGLPQPKGIRSINQVSRNGTSFPPTGRRRKSPEPDSTQVKLFVRYMPHNKSMEDVFHLFGLYGHIHTLEYHTEHKDKLYLVRGGAGGVV